MKTSSAKAKGREFQKVVRDKLRLIGAKYMLVDEDIESRPMGQNGTDIILSPAARTVFGNLQVECKKVEKLNVIETFMKHAERYKDIPGDKLLIHTRNSKSNKRVPALVTMDIDCFMDLIDTTIEQEYLIKRFTEDLIDVKQRVKALETINKLVEEKAKKK